MLTSSNVGFSEAALSALARANSVDEIGREFGEFGAFVGALFGEAPGGDKFATRSLIRNVGDFVETAKSPAHAVGPLSLAASARNVFGTSDRLADFVWDLPQSSYKFSGLPVLNGTKWIDTVFCEEPQASRVKDLLVSLVEETEILADANAYYRFSIQPFASAFVPPRNSPRSRRHMRRTALYGALPDDLEKVIGSRYMSKLVRANPNAPRQIFDEAKKLGIPQSVAVAIWNQHSPTALIDRLFEYRQLKLQAGVIEHDQVGTDLLLNIVVNGTQRGVFRNDEDRRAFDLHVLSDDPNPKIHDDWFQLRIPRVDTELQLRAARRLVERGVQARLEPRQMTTGDLHLRVGLCDVATPDRRPQTPLRSGLEKVFYAIEGGDPYTPGARTWTELALGANKIPFPIPEAILRYEEIPFGWSIGRNIRAHVVRDGLELLRNADLMSNCTADFQRLSSKGKKLVLAFHDELAQPIFNVVIYPTEEGFRIENRIFGWDNGNRDPAWLVGELGQATRAVRGGAQGMARLRSVIARDRARLESTREGTRNANELGLDLGPQIFVEY